MQLLRDAGRGAPPGAASAFVTSSAQADCLQQAARRVANKQLQQLLPAGIGFHNAGLDAEERTIVEGLFLAAHLLVRTPVNVITGPFFLQPFADTRCFPPYSSRPSTFFSQQSDDRMALGLCRNHTFQSICCAFHMCSGQHQHWH